MVEEEGGVEEEEEEEEEGEVMRGPQVPLIHCHYIYY